MSAALELLGGLRLEDGRPWAGAATGWQHADAAAILDGEAPYAFLTRPRGGSKTTDVAGVVLAWLLTAAPGLRGYGGAADRDQAALVIDAVAGFVARTPGIAAGLVEVTGFTVRNRRTGTSFEALAADGASAFGLKPSLVVLDELAAWTAGTIPRRFFEALFSSVGKMAGCRLVVITSAGDPAHWSHKVLESARESPRWHVSEVPGPLPWVDPEALEEQRRILLPSQYARLHLNIWTAPDDALALPDDIAACATLDGPQDYDPGHAPYAVAADLSARRDRTVVVVAHLEPERSYHHGASRREEGYRVVVDRKFMWRPAGRRRPVDLDEVERTIAQASRLYGGAKVVMDPWQGNLMAQRLRSQGVPVTEQPVTQALNTRLATTLFGLVRDRRLAFDAADEDLRSELASVRLVETALGQYRVDHTASGHNDQVFCVGLAALTLLERPVHVRGVARYEQLVGHWSRSSADPEAEADFARLESAYLARGDPALRRPVYDGDSPDPWLLDAANHWRRR